MALRSKTLINKVGSYGFKKAVGEADNQDKLNNNQYIDRLLNKKQPRRLSD